MHELLGPHEHKEFKLLQAGVKHVALFCDIIPEDYFFYKHKSEYGYIEFEKDMIVKNEKVNIQYAILYKNNHSIEAARLEEILKYHSDEYVESIEREIGKILSYSNEAIEYYLAHVHEIKSKQRDN